MTQPASKFRMSLILLTYNQESIVKLAAESCLLQDCEPIEIIFSDDASTDGTFRVLETLVEEYRGPHQVRALCNETNLGIGAHYNKLLTETSGELLVTAAGDDISAPQRLKRLAQAWDATGQRADLIASHFTEIKTNGTSGRHIATDNLSEVSIAGWSKQRPYVVGATHAFTRRMMLRFGPFIEHIWYEDQIMLLRALMGGGAVTVTEPLVMYRLGGSSNAEIAYTGKELVTQFRTQNLRALAEIEQLLQDAEKAGFEELVRGSLSKSIKREYCIRAILDAPSFALRYKACMAEPSVPLLWSLRKCLYFSYPNQAAWIRNHRIKIRKNLRSAKY